MDHTNHDEQPTRFETIAFKAGDGLDLNLKHAIRTTPASKGPVLLVHGAGVRADIFLAPVKTNIVDYLLAAGYDVWLENWRASFDVEQNPWTLDQAALFDHPLAVQKVVELTGAKTIKAIIHCQGSTSFMISAVAGLVPQVDTIVSNAVSLHPVVSTAAKIKINFAPPLVSKLTDYLDPRTADNPQSMLGHLLPWFIKATHHECENLTCRYASFLYGVGFPVLWQHENLNHETHHWLEHEFGFLPMTFYKQMSRSINRGRLLTTDTYKELQNNLQDGHPKTHARFAFFAGKENHCFKAESQARTFNYFNRLQPGFHSLQLIDNYGHLCMFMGENAAQDVFPLMLAELDKSTHFATDDVDSRNISLEEVKRHATV
ncbi:MAG: alpha/beta hydrolase [Gammaproteobacteria bacterium]|nr:alpha/beta hydrolase [Gammaproteobacteria bacterium]